MNRSLPRKYDYQGIAIALFSTATWATAGIFIRQLPGWSPFAILAGRFLVGAIALSPVIFASSIRSDLFRSVQKPDIWLLSLPMIFGYLLGTTAFQLAPVGEATLLISTSPLFIVAYRLLAKIPIRRGEGLGTLLAIAGVWLMVLPLLVGDRALPVQTAIGYFFALSAAACLAIYILWFGALAQRGTTFRSINVVFVTCLLGFTLSSIGLAFISNPIGLTDITQQSVLTLLGLGILSTATSTLFYTIAAQRLPALLTAAILLTEPAFAALFATIILQEIPSLWFYAGSGLVLGGLFAIAKATQPKRPET